jgi:hypothetical protein
MGWCRGGCGYRAGNFNDYTRSFCDPGIFEWDRMDTGRLNRVGGRDEECDEYESSTRAAFHGLHYGHWLGGELACSHT